MLGKETKYIAIVSSSWKPRCFKMKKSVAYYDKKPTTLKKQLHHPDEGNDNSWWFLLCKQLSDAFSFLFFLSQRL
jgi:hypothetical protein